MCLGPNESVAKNTEGGEERRYDNAAPVLIDTRRIGPDTTRFWPIRPVWTVGFVDRNEGFPAGNRPHRVASESTSNFGVG